MNINLQWSTKFSGICSLDDVLIPSFFHLKLNLRTNTEDSRFQNIAFERMKFMIEEVFHNSIFINENSPWKDLFSDVYPEKLVMLPDEVCDQVVGIALFCKVNAIMENALICEQLQIGSGIDEQVINYQVTSENIAGPFIVVKPAGRKKKITPWWNRSDVITFDHKNNSDPQTWAEIGLEWDDDKNKTVVELEWDETAIIDMKARKKGHKFVPEVLDGGKNIDEN